MGYKDIYIYNNAVLLSIYLIQAYKHTEMLENCQKNPWTCHLAGPDACLQLELLQPAIAPGITQHRKGYLNQMR